MGTLRLSNYKLVTKHTCHSSCHHLWPLFMTTATIFLRCYIWSFLHCTSGIVSHSIAKQNPWRISSTAQKMKISIKDFFSKFDKIRRNLRIRPHLLKESVKENFSFCRVKLVSRFKCFGKSSQKLDHSKQYLVSIDKFIAHQREY